jgi:hypothetical protein
MKNTLVLALGLTATACVSPPDDLEVGVDIAAITGGSNAGGFAIKLPGWPGERREGYAAILVPGSTVVPPSCYDMIVHAALWVVMIVAGILVLDFVFDVLGIASFIFSSRRKK